MTRPRSIEQRPYVAGRLRNGIMAKVTRRDGSSYTAPTAVDFWMFTSPDRGLIEQVQAAYGGEITKWDEPKANPPNQWKLTTNTNRVTVFLPSDAMETTWEKWVGQTCERRCDMRNCWFNVNGVRDLTSCVCADEPEETQCKPKSRLTVMLPAANMAGVWRFDSNSYFFATEAPAMIDQIEMLMQMKRISIVDLVLTNRSGTAMIKGKKTKTNFVVPTIQIGHTPEQVLAGHASLGALTQGEGPKMLALDKGWTEPVTYDPVFHTPFEDDEVLDAEVLDEVRVQSPVRQDTSEGWDVPPPGVSVRRNPRYGEPNERKYVRKI